MRTTVLEFKDGALSFAAGHFTIFSPQMREKLHGHTYQLQVFVTTSFGADGICFDYNILRKKLVALCADLHTRFLLAEKSPYLKFYEEEEYFIAEFNNQKIPFLKEDILLLPIANVTLEELSHWFLEEITADPLIKDHNISEVKVKVFNSPRHSASAGWSK